MQASCYVLTKYVLEVYNVQGCAVTPCTTLYHGYNILTNQIVEWEVIYTYVNSLSLRLRYSRTWNILNAISNAATSVKDMCLLVYYTVQMISGLVLC